MNHFYDEFKKPTYSELLDFLEEELKDIDSTKKLMISFEISAVATRIGEKVKDTFTIDSSVFEITPLLIDLVRPPFGEIGEKTLHNILAGHDDCLHIVNDVKALNVAQSFKQNLTSARLMIDLTEQGVEKKKMEKVLDAVLKNREIYFDEYKEDIALNEEFKYIVKDFKNLNGEDYYNHNPKYIEGYILSISTKVIDLFIDYINLMKKNKMFKFEIEKSEFYSYFKTSIDSFLEMDISSQATALSNELIRIFIDEIKKDSNHFILSENSIFFYLFNAFQKIKNDVLNKDLSYKITKGAQELIIKQIFANYYQNPFCMNEVFFKHFYGSIMDIKGLPKNIYQDMTMFKEVVDIKDEEQLVKIQEKMEDFLKECRKNIAQKDLPSSLRDSYRTIYKQYLKSIAFYIACMTDEMAYKESVLFEKEDEKE